MQNVTETRLSEIRMKKKCADEQSIHGQEKKISKMLFECFTFSFVKPVGGRRNSCSKSQTKTGQKKNWKNEDQMFKIEFPMNFFDNFFLLQKKGYPSVRQTVQAWIFKTPSECRQDFSRPLVCLAPIYECFFLLFSFAWKRISKSIDKKINQCLFKM